MRVSPLEKTRRANERALTQLERRYDKEGEPQRRLAQDIQEIGRLYRDGVIDVGHADLLRERAQRMYDEYRNDIEGDRETNRHHKKIMSWSGCVLLFFVLFAVFIVWCFAALTHG